MSQLEISYLPGHYKMDNAKLSNYHILMMTEIPIDIEIANFARHLENNPRVIFSAKFGDGKSYFLQKFKEETREDIYAVTIYPLNYSVAKNEDIFEYIKRDILLHLRNEGIYENIDIDAVGASLFSMENTLEVIDFLAKSLPYGEITSKIIRKGFDLKESYDKKRKKTLKEYADKFLKNSGGIYEKDAFTSLIEKIVSKLKKGDKRVVLLIEDLDRLDPAHLFRILNVLGAHINDNENTNKFGFDNIVIVMDYEITEHIFHHFYGIHANYAGYINKFVSKYPYRYSITGIAQVYLFQFIEHKCGLSEDQISNFKVSCFPEEKSLPHVISSMSVRDIVKIVDDFESQYTKKIYSIRNNYLIDTDALIVRFLSIIKRMQCDISDQNIVNSLLEIEGTSGIDMFGGFLFKDRKFFPSCCIKKGGKRYLCEMTNKGNVVNCKYVEALGGPNYQGNVQNLFMTALSEAKKFVRDYSN